MPWLTRTGASVAGSTCSVAAKFSTSRRAPPAADDERTHAQLGRHANGLKLLIGLMLCLSRNLVAGDAFVRDVLRKPKLWIKGDDHELEQLAGHWPPAGAAA